VYIQVHGLLGQSLDGIELPSVFVVCLLRIYWKEVLHEVFSKLVGLP